ncbi:DUF3311 domain-containing protein [Streptomyces sp. HNM0575]|uniref:DUF3311 domain-containing protein n=1 Tax=Streptomyces sp. HNM0575 TaxID=2716338 RepID=UPI00145C7C92|nr:DUF3311 domain-containing protein [Streptomyces sp. HNM0575]NLU73321.1 DUF3311 domain-containing protein [Streptomyces sp. HNM0575]
MSETRSEPGPEEPGRPDPLPFGALPAASRRRRSLWLLVVPAVLYGAAPVVANSIEPRILGVPFLLAWIIMASVVSPLVIWAAARLDPAYRADALEPIPADDVPEDSAPEDSAPEDAASEDAAAGGGRGPATGGAA